MKRVNAAQHILIFCVRLYRWVLSPAKTFLFGPLGRCRFTPSCSEYALEALRSHGALAGSWLAVKRMGRCHPWGGCGHDPVPAGQSKVQSPKSKVPGRAAAVFSCLLSPVSGLPSRFHSQRH
ncbi:MAG: membrane protein insertion efficiency factor YidD [Verrucomicrobiota bacterium]